MTRPSTLVVALAGSLLMWAALPPLALGWLGWIAPVPWLLLVRSETLNGRRPYWMLWMAAFVFWLASVHWLRLPHPAVYLGWIALSAYLAVYLPLFVGLSRVAVHRLHAPLWLAAPVVWTGLELARAHVMTGFMMGSLAHTQANWPAVIQISDLVGEYGVDFVIITVAACVACIAFRPRRPLAIIPAALILIATLLYGRSRLSDVDQQATSPPESVRVALIQGNSLADWKYDTARQQQIMNEYIELSNQALAESRKRDGRAVDLIVWPETMFRTPLMSFDPGMEATAESRQLHEKYAAAGPDNLKQLVTVLGTPVLVGIDRINYLTDPGANTLPQFLAYNSAALVDRGGRILGTYDKVHLVMFGEYVPFSKWLPFLKRISSITGAAEAGAGPVALCTGGVCYSPNICYETAIPHVIRNQVSALDAAGQRPDVLVNLTNDAWYWGSSELDMHLACDVFRAVETRTPLVIAANGGISAWIDRYGRVRAQSPRQQTDVILADVELNREARASVYIRTGDWFAGVCLICCVALAIIGWRGRHVTK